MHYPSYRNDVFILFSMYIAKKLIIVSLFRALFSYVDNMRSCGESQCEWIEYAPALWETPSWSTIWNRAPPSHLLLCALLTCSTPKSALWNSQIPGCESSIQCPVTAKYLSIFDTFHASHVMLTSPWTNFLYKMSMVTDARPVKMARVSLKIPWDRLTDSWTCSLSLPNLPSDLALWHHWWHMLQFQSWY